MKFGWRNEGWGKYPDVLTRDAPCPMCSGTVVSMGINAWRCTKDIAKYRATSFAVTEGKHYIIHTYKQLEEYEPTPVENDFGPVSP